MTTYQRLVVIAYSLIALANAASWLAILMLVDHSQLITILHYNIYFGPDLFGNWYELFYIPTIGLGIAIISVALTTWLWRRDRFLAYVTTAGAIGTQLVLTVAVALIVVINRT